MNSNDPLFTLGLSVSAGELEMTEGERESHIHVIGGPGQGKSKFLEYLVRHDIDRLHKDWANNINPREGRSCGLCFLDASEDGDTIRKILSYCAEINFKKVLIIDPIISAEFGKTPAISPFIINHKHWAASTQYLVDAFRVVFEVDDLSKTSYIKTYLTSLFGLFHFAGLTPSDLLYFTEPFDKDTPELEKYEEKRQKIYALVRQKLNSEKFPGRWRGLASKYLGSIQFAYKNIATFIREAGSSARRLNTIANPDLKEIFGHRQGVNFNKLVTEGWVILVNADTESLGDLEARLLETISKL